MAFQLLLELQDIVSYLLAIHTITYYWKVCVVNKISICNYLLYMPYKWCIHIFLPQKNYIHSELDATCWACFKQYTLTPGLIGDISILPSCTKKHPRRTPSSCPVTRRQTGCSLSFSLKMLMPWCTSRSLTWWKPTSWWKPTLLLASDVSLKFTPSTRYKWTEKD